MKKDQDIGKRQCAKCRRYPDDKGLPGVQQPCLSESFFLNACKAMRQPSEQALDL